MFHVNRLGRQRSHLDFIVGRVSAGRLRAVRVIAIPRTFQEGQSKNDICGKGGDIQNERKK